MNITDKIFHDEDAARAAIALKGMEGKRLTYRRIDKLAA